MWGGRVPSVKVTEGRCFCKTHTMFSVCPWIFKSYEVTVEKTQDTDIHSSQWQWIELYYNLYFQGYGTKFLYFQNQQPSPPVLLDGVNYKMCKVYTMYPLPLCASMLQLFPYTVRCVACYFAPRVRCPSVTNDTGRPSYIDTGCRLWYGVYVFSVP